MTYSIVYSTITGNAKLLANRIKDVLKDGLVYFGPPQNDIPDSDIIFVGFYTTFGECNENIKEYLKTLKNKKVFLFGTCGFGLSEDYFKKILDKSLLNLDCSNTLIGTFMCQGKMQIEVREKYTRLKESANPPEHIDEMIANFDEALMHPSVDDLVNFTEILLNLKEALK